MQPFVPSEGQVISELVVYPVSSWEEKKGILWLAGVAWSAAM